MDSWMDFVLKSALEQRSQASGANVLMVYALCMHEFARAAACMREKPPCIDTSRSRSTGLLCASLTRGNDKERDCEGSLVPKECNQEDLEHGNLNGDANMRVKQSPAKGWNERSSAADVPFHLSFSLITLSLHYRSQNPMSGTQAKLDLKHLQAPVIQNVQVPDLKVASGHLQCLCVLKKWIWSFEALCVLKSAFGCLEHCVLKNAFGCLKQCVSSKAHLAVHSIVCA
eukprot:scaffold36268_cov16-Tisochrysis_lutea.AAC.1